MIERYELVGHSAAEVGDYISAWKALRDEGWDVQLLTESFRRGAFLVTTSIVALAVKP